MTDREKIAYKIQNILSLELSVDNELDILGIGAASFKIADLLSDPIFLAENPTPGNQVVGAEPACFVSEENKWIEWAGGEQPISDETYAETKLRDGTLLEAYPAEGIIWTKYNQSTDIVAYRVVTALPGKADGGRPVSKITEETAEAHCGLEPEVGAHPINALIMQNEWLKARVTDRELPSDSTKNNEEYLLEAGMPAIPATATEGE